MMKKYLKPESEMVELQMQGLIAASIQMFDGETASEDCENLSNDRSAWGDIWK